MMSLVKGIWSFIIVDPIAVPHKITNTCRSCKCLKNLYLFRTYCATERIIFCPPSTPLQDDKVSFAHFVLPLPESSDQVDEDLLAMCYVSLMQRALTFFQDWTNESPELTKSYNVLLTKKWICVVPRSHAKSGPPLMLNINSTGYCGMILVKDREKLENLTEDPHLVDKSLLQCGFPNTAGQKPTEYHY